MDTNCKEIKSGKLAVSEKRILLIREIIRFIAQEILEDEMHSLRLLKRSVVYQSIFIKLQQYLTHLPKLEKSLEREIFQYVYICADRIVKEHKKSVIVRSKRAKLVSNLEEEEYIREITRAYYEAYLILQVVKSILPSDLNFSAWRLDHALGELLTRYGDCKKKRQKDKLVSIFNLKRGITTNGTLPQNVMLEFSGESQP